MNNRLLWVAIVIILVIAAIIYFTNSGTTDQSPKDRPSPHSINQGNG
ncbi:hypothetical protein [Rhizobium sp. C1]|nr:hypothetical protein [Rhizobium sp. C1]MCD2178937.1 hypothetical protein [Rhizobium sp. C1]